MSMLHGSINRKAIHTLLQRGETPLITAAIGRNVESLSMLLDYQAEVNAKDRAGMTALLHAALWHHTAVLPLLLTRGADVHAKSHTGKTALMLAAWPEDFEGNRSEDLATIALLIEAGVEINATDEEGSTALHHLAQDHYHGSGHEEVARLLIAAGVDVSIQDRLGRTALSYAEENNRANLVAALHQAASNEGRIDK